MRRWMWSVKSEMDTISRRQGSLERKAKKAAEMGLSAAIGLGGRSDGLGLGGLDERADPAPEVVLGDVQRRDEPHDLVVRSGGDEQHVPLERAVDRGLRRGLVAELDRGHGAERSDLADPRVALQRCQLFDDDLADEIGALDELLVLQHVQRRKS